jgi:hypothetical protein
MKRFLMLALIFLVKLSFSQSTVISPGSVKTEFPANFASKGLLPPKLSIQNILAIQNPIKGTLVYDTSNNVLRMFNGKQWIRFKAKGTPIYPIL